MDLFSELSVPLILLISFGLKFQSSVQGSKDYFLILDVVDQVSPVALRVVEQVEPAFVVSVFDVVVPFLSENEDK